MAVATAPPDVPHEVQSQPKWVLLALEAKMRGFRNTLAFRRWCRRNRVLIRRTGRMEVVCPADVDAAVLGRALPASDLTTLAAQSVARSLHRGGR